MVDRIAPTAKPVATAMESALRTTNKSHQTYVVVLSKGMPMYSHDEVAGEWWGESGDGP